MLVAYFHQQEHISEENITELESDKSSGGKKSYFTIFEKYFQSQKEVNCLKLQL